MADILTLRKFEALSPFEIKNELIIATTSHHALTRHQNQRTK